jgi:hypothetical protein
MSQDDQGVELTHPVGFAATPPKRGIGASATRGELVPVRHAGNWGPAGDRVRHWPIALNNLVLKTSLVRASDAQFRAQLNKQSFALVLLCNKYLCEELTGIPFTECILQ